jgi:hypothetical protein
MSDTKFSGDISPSLAQAAHAGTSMVPEERGRQMLSEYAATLAEDYANLERLATTDDKRALLAEEFARYRAGYRAKYTAWLHSRSRCLSTMITGPSNFNVRRNEKRNAVADRRNQDLLDFRERALKAIRRTLCPELAPIMAGDADATERLADKIAKAEATHERMKAINRAYDAFKKDPASLDKSDLSDAEKAAVRKWTPEFSFDRHPFPPYALSNSSANIRRMKERLEQVSRAKTETTTQAEGTAAKYEDCPPDNRVRLFFPGKPSAEIRDTLKSGGFRWTPSLGCWQAYRHPHTLALARKVAGVAAADGVQA